VKVLGGIFNKIPLDGYYSHEYSSAAITSYFQQYRSDEMPYGYIPILQVDDADDDDVDLSNEDVYIQKDHSVHHHDIDKDDRRDYHDDHAISDTNDGATQRSSKLKFTSFEWKLSNAFIKHVDIQRLMHDIWCYEVIHVLVYICTHIVMLSIDDYLSFTCS
jgi:hypothetical protein